MTWQEAYDTESGRSFYFDSETGMSAWGNPDAVWQEYLDSATGVPFFHNSETGESRWTAPDSGGIEEGSEEAGPDEVWTVRRRRSVATGVTNNWVQYLDEKTNATFWYNAKTNESQWEPPEHAAGGPKDPARGPSHSMTEEKAGGEKIEANALDRKVALARLDAEQLVCGKMRTSLARKDLQLRVLLARLDAEEKMRQRAERHALMSAHQARQALVALEREVSARRVM